MNLRPRVKQIQPLADKDTSRRFLFRCYEFLVKAALSPPSRTVCGLISPSSYPCTLNAARLNATSPLERTFDMAPNCSPDSRQTQRLIAALGIAMPLATNWHASEKAAYYQRFLLSLDPRFHDEVHNAARTRLLRKLLALTANG